MTQLNKNTCRPREALNEVSRKYPGLWKNIDAACAWNAKKSKAWPDYRFISMSFIKNMINRFFICHTNRNREQKIVFESVRINALAVWRNTQGIYRFDADVYKAVLNTPADAGFPLEALVHLPELCVYIETPDLLFMGEKVHGAWMHIDWDASCEMDYLCFLIDAPRQITARVQLTHEPIEEQLKKIDAARGDAAIFSKPGLLAASVTLLSTLISLALFLCMQADEVGSGAERPTKPTPKRIKGGDFRFSPPNHAATWEVGVRMGAALRQARHRAAASERGGEESPGNALRGHIRRAHWHTVVSGPRKTQDGAVLPTSQRKLKVRWQPSLAINAKHTSALPSTIRVVDSGFRAVLPGPPQVFACPPASSAASAAGAQRA